MKHIRLAISCLHEVELLEKFMSSIWDIVRNKVSGIKGDVKAKSGNFNLKK